MAIDGDMKELLEEMKKELDGGTQEPQVESKNDLIEKALKIRDEVKSHGIKVKGLLTPYKLRNQCGRDKLLEFIQECKNILKDEGIKRTRRDSEVRSTPGGSRVRSTPKDSEGSTPTERVPDLDVLRRKLAETCAEMSIKSVSFSGDLFDRIAPFLTDEKLPSWSKFDENVDMDFLVESFEQLFENPDVYDFVRKWVGPKLKICMCLGFGLSTTLQKSCGEVYTEP